MKDFRTRNSDLERWDRMQTSDDFFGFQVTSEDASLLRIAGYALVGIILLGTMWWGLGQVQQTCLERNSNDITLCV